MSTVQQANQASVSAQRREKIVSLHQVRSSWILQIDNQVLRAFIESNAAHIRPSQSQINAINHAHSFLVSSREFSDRLNQAGIFLSNKQVKWVNAENRQIFYRNRIESDLLREMVSDYRFRASRWHGIAKNQISLLNALVRRQVVPGILHDVLKRLGVELDKESLEAIIEESQGNDEVPPYLSVRRNCEALRHNLIDLDPKTIKRQFSGYLSLILNESALSVNEVEELKAELTNIVVIKSLPVQVENPFMRTVKSIRQRAERLYRRRIFLSLQKESLLHNLLIDQIDKTLSRIPPSYFELLFRQQIALEKWANCQVMSDVLYREIKQLTPCRVLQRTQAQELFEKLRNRSLRYI